MASTTESRTPEQVQRLADVYAGASSGFYAINDQVGEMLDMADEIDSDEIREILDLAQEAAYRITLLRDRLKRIDGVCR